MSNHGALLATKQWSVGRTFGSSSSMPSGTPNSGWLDLLMIGEPQAPKCGAVLLSTFRAVAIQRPHQWPDNLELDAAAQAASSHIRHRRPSFCDPPARAVNVSLSMTRFIPTTIDEMRFVIAAPRGRGAGRAGELG
jgi:hypothetical protein